MNKNSSHHNPHDKTVTELAERLRSQGLRVQADVSGFRKPPLMTGVRPDIVARGPGVPPLIIEVETKKSMPTDLAQRRALREHAEQMGADFKVVRARRRT